MTQKRQKSLQNHAQQSDRNGQIASEFSVRSEDRDEFLIGS